MTIRSQASQRACRIHSLFDRRITSGRSTHRSQRWHAYATQTSTSGTSSSKRRAVTVTSDDGRYTWSELSTGEKVARTTQQSFNFVYVTAGVIATVAISYFLYAELFAADSKTRQFNAAVDKVKADSRCRELLGAGNKIVAYGEPTSSKWARARPLAYTSEIDRYGVTHFRMRFNMEGPLNRGVVSVHMTKRPSDYGLTYNLLSLTVPGHTTIYLENTNAPDPKRGAGKIFGFSWR